LIGRQPVLKKVNVVGHQSPVSAILVRSKSLRWLRLQCAAAEVANQYVNTNAPCWLERCALKMLRFAFVSRTRPCDNPEHGLRA
jgi:hypothetical protein